MPLKTPLRITTLSVWHMKSITECILMYVYEYSWKVAKIWIPLLSKASKCGLCRPSINVLHLQIANYHKLSHCTHWTLSTRCSNLHMWHQQHRSTFNIAQLCYYYFGKNKECTYTEHWSLRTECTWSLHVY